MIALLQGAQESTAIYHGSWKADWLLSEIHSQQWIVQAKTGGNVSKERPNVITINWSIILPNGSDLIDPTNKIALHTAQKIAFLSRSLPEGGIKSAGTLVDFVASLKTLVQWLYLHKSFYKPAKNAFASFDQYAIQEFLGAIARGGVPALFDLEARIFIFLYRNAIGHDPESELVANYSSLPCEVTKSISNWLLAEGFFKPSSSEKDSKFLNVGKLLSAAGVNWMKIRNSKQVLHFLRQFELEIDSNILTTRRLLREFPTAFSPILNDIEHDTFSQSGVESWSKTISRVLRLHRHLPDVIPDSSNISMPIITAHAVRGCAHGGHTPWMPLDTALTYSIEAIRWVHLYGNDLVEAYLSITRKILEAGAFNAKGVNTLSVRDRTVAEHLFPESLKHLHICGWSSAIREHGRTTNGYAVMRATPSLTDAMAILIGSIIVSLGITKPIRDEEIRNLRRDCIRFVARDGYWLHQHRGKASNQDSPFMNSKPIPAVVANALILMRRLGDGLRQLTGCDAAGDSDFLFFLPLLFSEGAIKAKPMTRDMMNQCLDRFCDYINLPTDRYGRRWYVRTHQLRKSFLITFFWVFKFSSLEACRWISGHRDTRDVYAYIQANTPGEEISALEAEYASIQLWDFDQGKSAEGDNIAELYAAVCRHFGVGSLELISESDLTEWLELAFLQGDYLIEPYSIFSDDGRIFSRICYRISTNMDKT